MNKQLTQVAGSELVTLNDGTIVPLEEIKQIAEAHNNFNNTPSSMDYCKSIGVQQHALVNLARDNGWITGRSKSFSVTPQGEYALCDNYKNGYIIKDLKPLIATNGNVIRVNTSHSKLGELETILKEANYDADTTDIAEAVSFKYKYGLGYTVDQVKADLGI